MLKTPQQALAEILSTVGLDPAPANLRIDGAEPALPSRFPVSTAGASCLGAIGVALSDLWTLRGGSTQQVSISLDAAAAAMRGERYLRRDQGAPAELFDPISGFYQAGDGRWIQFHCNFPHHRAGVLAYLGVPADKDAVVAAVKKQPDCLALETALIERGMCVAMIRSPEEWQAHPQGKAVAGLPLMEVVRIGDSPPEPMPKRNGVAQPRPLDGLKVLDLTRVIAGPTCGRVLAEHGATVMRVASPTLPFIETLVMASGHGKLSAHIDLTHQSGRETLGKLVRDADIFVQGYRPGAVSGQGFGPEEVAALRPGIIYTSLSAFGHEGPWNGRRGFDSLLQSTSGIGHEGGTWDATNKTGQPKHLPCQALDYCAGYLMAFGSLIALARRARDGGSWMVRVSLAQAGWWIQNLGRIPGTPENGVAPTGDDGHAAYMMASDTPFGRLDYVGPVLTLSETPGRWDLPSVPLGTHPPVWP